MAKLRIPARLAALMNGMVIGHVERANGRLTFRYDSEWIVNRPDFPLSLSMTTAKTVHEHDRISNFMWGLLPDNVHILEGIGRQHGVPASNPYTLLWKIGEDCPGALQFTEEERIPDIRNKGTLTGIDDAEISRRLTGLRTSASTGRISRTEGQFSLSGAQPKTALSRIDGQWFIPSGRIPTTHILKPPIPDFKGQVENEHFCLTLAGKMGLRSAESTIMHFGDEMAIVVKRYDRYVSGNRIIRIHQEDMCQALGIHPELKYENKGGPGIVEIMDALYSVTSPHEDRTRFMTAIVYNSLICGTDAHAKNYSVLIAPRTRKLAPLYDLISFLPYADHMRSIAMSMRIDKYYDYETIQRRHWERMAKTVRFPADELISIIETMTRYLPQAAVTTADELRKDGITHDVVGHLVDAITDRCRSVGMSLGLTATGRTSESISRDDDAAVRELRKASFDLALLGGEGLRALGDEGRIRQVLADAKQHAAGLAETDPERIAFERVLADLAGQAAVEASMPTDVSKPRGP